MKFRQTLAFAGITTAPRKPLFFSSNVRESAHLWQTIPHASTLDTIDLHESSTKEIHADDRFQIMKPEELVLPSSMGSPTSDMIHVSLPSSPKETRANEEKPIAGKDDKEATVKNDLIPMKEILFAKIVDPKSKDPPFHDTVLDLIPNKSDIYITFKHRGQHRGKSLAFGDADEAWANLPLRADGEKDIECEIRRKMSFGRKKTLFTAKLNLGNDKPDMRTGLGEIEGKIEDLNHKDTGLILKLELFSTEWDEDHVDKKDDERQMDFFHEVLKRLLASQVKGMNAMGVKGSKKPIEKANPDLKRHTDLDGRLEYPTTDEFVVSAFTCIFVCIFVFKLRVSPDILSFVFSLTISQNSGRRLSFHF